MIRKGFIIANIGLTVVFLGLGIEPYLKNPTDLDAGVMHLFLAFWFGFAAYGFYQKNIWLVTMPNLFLVLFFCLHLFMLGLAAFHSGGSLTEADMQAIGMNLGLMGFAVAGEIYALWRKGRDDTGTR